MNSKQLILSIIKNVVGKLASHTASYARATLSPLIQEMEVASGGLNIKVKAYHIEEGRPCECEMCPVAIALAEKLPEADKIFAGKRTIDIHFGSRMYSMTTPYTVKWWMDWFDSENSDMDIQPFSFILPAPSLDIGSTELEEMLKECEAVA